MKSEPISQRIVRWIKSKLWPRPKTGQPGPWKEMPSKPADSDGGAPMPADGPVLIPARCKCYMTDVGLFTKDCPLHNGQLFKLADLPRKPLRRATRRAKKR